MARIERIREIVSGPVDPADWKQKTDAGWKLVALEWRREIEGEEPESATIMEEVPYGLRVAADCQRLEDDPHEREVLMQIMELIVQDLSVSEIASQLSRRGLRTRKNLPWSSVNIFNMLPRLIEVGPKMFSAEEWEARRDRVMRSV
ncbi:MAG TPA: recombinase family protein [Candidatus Angelobacter sp.]|nr:recombinase family protein [Candidatus Angelobacter sp.]